ncbi:hypothetical protein BFJ63_vAg15919 [Fusarium oxysporum f. sp. narcissi]|uniref:Uncharacterized protein n=1 Tax=Fusarium oxysporum f. sp. narcissi TaxID=451672 RepID=A0A4Q2V2K6_FUSOX|nr:hypothetical protein BFJ63_vAg15919 [Fusarium oxysporum f. sp. narcissi]
MADAVAGVFVQFYESIKENCADGDPSNTASQSTKSKGDSATGERAIQASSKA